MAPSTRYGLVGIGALAGLTAAHQLRGSATFREPIVDYLLGVAPNFTAAIAITFVTLSIWADQRKNAQPQEVSRAFLVCAGISGAGLIAWECFQLSGRLVFDRAMTAAVLVPGAGAGGLAGKVAICLDTAAAPSIRGRAIRSCGLPDLGRVVEVVLAFAACAVVLVVFMWYSGAEQRQSPLPPASAPTEPIVGAGSA